jgi:cobalamin biosynthesis protein CbiG
MHAEHAELISALRQENERLNIKVAELSALQTVIDAQDKVLAAAQKTLREQGDIIQRLVIELRSYTEAAP